VSLDDPSGERLADYQYDLPASAIAQAPLPERAASRLLVAPGAGREAPSHHRIGDLPSLVRGDELFVLNDTRVVPARLWARKPSGGRVELLVLGPAPEGLPWVVTMGRSAKPLRPPLTLRLPSGDLLEVARGPEEGRLRVRLPLDPAEDLHGFLSRHGEVPLPPYIARPEGPTPEDVDRYQTVYARVPGAVAAPTAGLHFTPELLDALRARGCELAWLTLQVGPGTFQPVRADRVREHRMQPEEYAIGLAAAEAWHRAHDAGRPVVAVGTTVVRALEASAARHGAPSAERASTDLFILPGHRFRAVDQILTNFHLPGSTLLMLVSAFAGRKPVLGWYREALEAGYRFYSYGDAMWIR
jgi:S-adenosylmethionine:tRNA ribosyltransferase-isomerase